jgi:hypothetical protein
MPETIEITSLLSPTSTTGTSDTRLPTFICSDCSTTAPKFLVEVCSKVTVGDSPSVITLAIAWFEGTVTSKIGVAVGNSGVSGVTVPYSSKDFLCYQVSWQNPSA